MVEIPEAPNRADLNEIDIYDRKVRFIGFPSGPLRAPSWTGLFILVTTVVSGTVIFARRSLPHTFAYLCFALAGLIAIYQLVQFYRATRALNVFVERQEPRGDIRALGANGPLHFGDRDLLDIVLDGWKKYARVDLSRIGRYIADPSHYNVRVKEIIEPTYESHRHSVTKTVRWVHSELTSRRSNLVPIGEFEKGALLEGFSCTVDDRTVDSLSVLETWQLIGAIILNEAIKELAPLSSQSRIFRRKTSIADFGDALLGEPAIVLEVIAAMRAVTSPRTNIAPNGEAAGAPSKLENVGELVRRLSDRYLIIADVPSPSGSLLTIVYRQFVPYRPTEADLPDGRARRRSRVRFKSGQFPSEIKFVSRYAGEAQSYHLTVTVPTGLFVGTHIVKGEPQSVVANPRPGRSFDSPYARARRLEGLPYAHFYSRNGRYLKYSVLEHLISVEESPFFSLRLAASLSLLTALSIAFGALEVVGVAGTYAVRSLAVPILVSIPGVVAGWSRQVFAPESLRRACLTSQMSLRITVALSFAAVALTALQDAGYARWHFRSTSNWELPHWLLIRDGFWLVLLLLSISAAAVMFARYRKRRRQYLAVLSRTREVAIGITP